jgi:hypothetical protein
MSAATVEIITHCDTRRSAIPRIESHQISVAYYRQFHLIEAPMKLMAGSEWLSRSVVAGRREHIPGFIAVEVLPLIKVYICIMAAMKAFKRILLRFPF